MGEQDFSEVVKLEVKKKAGFQCCRCHEIGVEVHHIIPQEYGGTKDIDNAAPLCPNCHSFFGGNPDKRKEITQMRDWWYEQVTKMYPDNRQLPLLEEINSKVDKLQQNQITLDDFKGLMFKFAYDYLNTPQAYETIYNMTAGTASAIINASGSASPSASSSPSPYDD